MLYAARSKKITVDQNKVLKNQLNRLFHFFWPPGIMSIVFFSQVLQLNVSVSILISLPEVFCCFCPNL